MINMHKTHCVKSFQIRSFSWSIFSRIRTEYGDLLRKPPCSVRIQENLDQKKTPYYDTFHTVTPFWKRTLNISLWKGLIIILHYSWQILAKSKSLILKKDRSNITDATVWLVGNYFVKFLAWQFQKE